MDVHILFHAIENLKDREEHHQEVLGVYSVKETANAALASFGEVDLDGLVKKLDSDGRYFECWWVDTYLLQ